jgi:hypothetical protein
MTLVVRRCFQCSAGKSQKASSTSRSLIKHSAALSYLISTKASNAVRLGHPDLLQYALGFRLLALRQLVQHIGGLVNPAALAAGFGPHFLDHLPESERPVGNGELKPDRQPAALQVEKQFLPGLRALAHAVDEPDKFRFALRRGADDDQQALGGVLQPGLHVDAFDPEVHVALG